MSDYMDKYGAGEEAGKRAYRDGYTLTGYETTAFDRGYWAEHDESFKEEILTAEDCLDNPRGGGDPTDQCDGAVEYRFPLSGTGKSFVRCDRHWEDRLAIQEGINRRYPDSPMPPSDFDPTYAGERWDDDY